MGIGTKTADFVNNKSSFSEITVEVLVLFVYIPSKSSKSRPAFHGL